MKAAIGDVRPEAVLGLGIRTDLMLLRGSADIQAHADCVAVVSQGNPDFYFGNFLVPCQQPTPESIPAWRARFAELIGQRPGIQHESFAWSSAAPDDGALEAFRSLGFRVGRSVVLACKPEQLQKPKHHVPNLACRTATRADLPQLWRLYARFSREQHGARLTAAERRFLRARIGDFAKMVEADLGHWHLAFMDGMPAAALGLFFERGVGRFQEVLTDARFRRRGICAALVHQTALQAFSAGAEQLVMIADADYHALRLYRGLGFRDAEGMITACKAP